MTEEQKQSRHHRLYSAIALLIVIALILLLLSQVIKAEVLLPDNLTPTTANAELAIINPLPYAVVEQLCSLNTVETITNQNPAFLTNTLYNPNYQKLAYIVAERRAIMQIKNEWCG